MAAVTVGLTDELIKARKGQAVEPAPAEAKEPVKAPRKKPAVKK